MKRIKQRYDGVSLDVFIFFNRLQISMTRVHGHWFTITLRYNLDVSETERI